MKIKDITNLKFNNDGLIPVIIQDNITKEVRMLGYMSKESLTKTIETDKVWFFSRSRKKLWLKGKTSGNYQMVKNILLDCDRDTLLIMVDQVNDITCHFGNKSCFK